jgi:leader peptidase (prepilin peptidase)/N-methyltransferase
VAHPARPLPRLRADQPALSFVELLGAAITVVLFRQFGLSVTPHYLWFCLALLASDADRPGHRIIPDAITLPGTVLGLALVRWTQVTWLEAALGAALGFGVLFLVGVAYEKATGVEGMGGGDVKLAAMMGAFLGWQGVVLSIFLGAFMGSLVGVAAMAGGKGNRRTALPFGTFLAPAAVIVLFAGPALWQWYMGLFRVH